ncbi:MAG: Polyprenyl synthetase [Gemmatimonadetes bacterium]|nr:Polyprenyl synthetase [Gemmatimonadota bacterium]
MSVAHAESQAAVLDLERFLLVERRRVDLALAQVAAGVLDGVAPALAQPMEYALATGGKRLRPILAAAAYRALRDEPDGRVYRLACALEMVHTYSLVHDDLPCMDDDDLRRGQPTVHRRFDAARATLAGAALIPAAVRVLDVEAASLGLSAETRSKLTVELCRAGGALGMVGGQLLDLQGEEVAVDAEGLERIHRGKTGALLAAALHVGALAAGADAGELAALTVYGEDLGLAFQIVDDLLDVEGRTEVLGKTRGRDLDLGKATYPSLYGIEGARVLAAGHVDEAVTSLRGAGIRSPELEALARYVLERAH